MTYLKGTNFPIHYPHLIVGVFIAQLWESFGPMSDSALFTESGFSGGAGRPSRTIRGTQVALDRAVSRRARRSRDGNARQPSHVLFWRCQWRHLAEHRRRPGLEADF